MTMTAEELDELRRLADAGDPDSMYRYASTLGARIERWAYLEMAAKKGHEQAINALANDPIYAMKLVWRKCVLRALWAGLSGGVVGALLKFLCAEFFGKPLLGVSFDPWIYALAIGIVTLVAIVRGVRDLRAMMERSRFRMSTYSSVAVMAVCGLIGAVMCFGLGLLLMLIGWAGPEILLGLVLGAVFGSVRVGREELWGVAFHRGWVAINIESVEEARGKDSKDT